MKRRGVGRGIGTRNIPIRCQEMEPNEVCWQILIIGLAVMVWVTCRDRPIAVSGLVEIAGGMDQEEFNEASISMMVSLEKSSPSFEPSSVKWATTVKPTLPGTLSSE